MILVTGANGFVGGKIMKLCADTIAAPSMRGLSEDEVLRIVCESGADTVIHTAAISDIGRCEENPEESYAANVMLPIYLARACSRVKLICFSSDQVYSGSSADGPFTERDVSPANLYSRHKLEMEERVLDILPDAVMLRAEWMYDYYLKKPNYFMNLINASSPLNFSSRQYRGITYVKEVCEVMERVIRLPGGAYNFGCETNESMYEITRDFLSYLGRDIPLLDAPPRHNLWMNCEKAKKYGVVFKDIKDGLRACTEDNRHLIKNF